MKKTRFKLMQPLGFCLAGAALCMLAGGCHQIVHIEDMQGNSLSEAHVTTQMSQDYGGGPGPSGVTNRFGNVMLKRTAYDNPPLWITVTRPGYRSRGIAYSPDDRIVIRLQQIVPQ